MNSSSKMALEKNKFILQDKQYERPYHHLVNFDDKKMFDYLPWGLEYFGYVKTIIEILQKQKFYSLAEVGCGDGKILLELAKRMPNIVAEGYDLSKRAVEFAKAYSLHLPNVSFFNVNFDKSGKKYDICLAIEVLEHIPDSEIDKFIKTIANNLDKDGKVIISVPSVNITLNKKHYRHYTKELLNSHVQKCFEVVSIFFVHKRSIFSSLLKKVLINRFFILNFPSLRRQIINLYENNCLSAGEANGSHIIAILKKSK